VEKQLASDANEAGITTLRNSDMKVRAPPLTAESLAGETPSLFSPAVLFQCASACVLTWQR
jgi:hypothetical protein